MQQAVNPMKLSAQLEQPHDEYTKADSVDNQSMMVPAKFISTTDCFEKKEHSWFAISQIPTDISIQVQEITFYTHKYPLVSKCGYFSRIEIQPQRSNISTYDIKLDNFPGGSDTFESILKFCYGLPINLNPNNVATLRCASEFLEMTEELEDGNLISKSEAFFTFVVLSSWKDSIAVLKSCETLSPWAENLQIVRRCCDSIAWKVSRETSTTIGELLNGDGKWWFEDLTTLRIDHFTRVITALKAKGMEPEIVGACIMQYGNRWLPGVESERYGLNYGKTEQLQWNVTSGRGVDEGDIGETRERRLLVESLVSMLPPQKEAVSCKFLLKMLKMAILYSASPALVSELEKRVGLVLENAYVNDLLIPSYAAVDQGSMVITSGEEHGTMHNIDVVQRILEYFLLYEQQMQQQQRPAGPLSVSKLLDNYLAEIARDPNLQVNKFIALAQSLPENARSCDDGVYRAIDIYLKAHPLLSDHERKRLCKVMECGKLSVDACAHAAQNDRLPLRTMIQVLFSEQVKIRESIQGKNEVITGDNSEQERSWSATNREVVALKTELENVKKQMEDIQRDYSELRQADHHKQNMNIQRRHSLGWKVLGWGKIRKSSLFNVKVDGDTTDDIRGMPNQRSRDGSRPRQSLQ